MKTSQKLITVLAVIALLLSMVSCAALQKKPNFTQKITAGNIEVTVRDDMKEDPSITSKGDSYITCYFWNGYGMNVGSVSATEVKFGGDTADTLLMKTLEGQKNLTDLKKYGDVSYAEYNITDGGKEYLFTNFILEEGSEFYFLEFYTMSKSSAQYMDQYQTIVDSVKMINQPDATKDITVKGINLTVDGDAIDKGSNVYLCSRYMVSGFTYNFGSLMVSAEDFCKSTIEQTGYVTADGQPVTEINTSSDGMASFESFTNDMYTYHYAKIVDQKLIYIFFFTTKPADDQLKSEFASIASAATATAE